MKKISKSIVEGESCELVGHLVESENHLGRSLVIDLDAPAHNNFRQVDHRSIEYIIYKNVKYTIGKKSADTAELPLRYVKTEPNWTATKLAVGNSFSAITYYKVKDIMDKENVSVVTSTNTTKQLTMSRDILEREMHSGLVYDKEEKVTRSEIVQRLVDAKESVMTVKFHKKIDDTYVKEILAGTKSNQFKDAKQLKQLS